MNGAAPKKVVLAAGGTGGHMFPAEALAREMIARGSHVVLVPAGVGSTDFGSAARAYWTFKVFGHDNVSILDGGFAAWKAAFPDQLESGAPVRAFFSFDRCRLKATA